MAAFLVTKVVAPSLWGWLADRTQKSMLIVRVGALLSLVSFCFAVWGQSYQAIFWIMVFFSFFRNAILPQMEAITLNYLKEQLSRYSQIRIWGSAGFVVAVFLVGLLVEHYDIGLLPVIVIVGCVGLVVNTFYIAEPEKKALSSGYAGLWRVLASRNVLVFFCVIILMQLSHGPYYTFFSVYMNQLEYSKIVIAFLWNLGVVAEIILFWFMHKIMSAYSAKAILLLSLLLAAVRWWLIGYYSDSLLLLVLAQILHAASFASFHAVCIHFVYLVFPRQYEGQGQALYSGISFGLGGAVGALIAGEIWRLWGPELCFLSGAISCGIAFFMAWIWIRYPRSRVIEHSS